MKNGQKKFYAWMIVPGIAACLLFMVSSPAKALWVGQSQVNPFLEVQGIYDSNIYRVNSDDTEDSDFITVISPGIHFEYPTSKDPQFQAGADYRANIRIYGNDGDAEIDPDGELNTVDHRAGAYLLFNLASGWKIKGGYTFNMNSSPPDYRGDKRSPYKEHLPLGVVGYNFADRYRIEFGYDGQFKSYDDRVDEVDDLTRNNLELNGFYRVLPKLSILLGGGYGLIDRKSPFYDSDEIRGYTGVEYEATEKTTGLLKVGIITKAFDTNDIDDASDVYASGEMRSEYREHSFWKLQIFREYNDTTVSDKTAQNGVYYITTGFGASIKHALATLPGLSLNGALGVSRDAYQEDENDREDDHFEFGAGMDYKFYKYVSLGVSYTYNSRDSNIDVNDFSDHIAMMKIQGIM